MRKRILALLLCSAVAVSGLTSCGQDEKTAVTTPEAAQQSSEISGNTMKPPEFGWTMEELLSHTYLCGKQLSYPLTVDDLGEDFTIDSDMFKSEDRFVTSTNYKGQFMAPCIFGEENNTEQELKNFRSFNVAMPENAEGFSFSINGAGFESSKEEVIKALGPPEEESSTGMTMIYYDREDKTSKLLITIADDKPVQLSFMFGKDEE